MLPDLPGEDSSRSAWSPGVRRRASAARVVVVGRSERARAGALGAAAEKTHCPVYPSLQQ